MVKPFSLGLASRLHVFYIFLPFDYIAHVPAATVVLLRLSLPLLKSPPRAYSFEERTGDRISLYDQQPEAAP